MIICCGESLIDMIPNEIDGRAAFVPHSGGAIFNTAIALGRLGAPTALISGISTDFLGEQLISTLQDSQVNTSYCVRTNRPTTLAFVTLKDGQAEYVFYNENSAGRILHFADLPDIPDTAQAMHFGAISLIADPAASAYEALMKRQSGQRTISFDPNIRPGFVADAGAYRARIDRMTRLSTIIKYSDEDLAWLTGDDKADISGILASGPQLVIVTHGQAGAEIHHSGGRIHIPAMKAKVVDTVGAGDTFNGAFLHALQKHGFLARERLAQIDAAALTACAEFAVRAAAITVTRSGANPPWRDEMQDLRDNSS